MKAKKKGRLLITINGVSLTRAKWAERLGVTRGGISWMEHARGMTPEQAVRHFYLKRRKPRNCDRFANAVEAMAELKRVHSYCAKENRRCLEDCPDCGKEWCSLAWLFAPATESEAAK